MVCIFCLYVVISIHTPTQGVTCCQLHTVRLRQNFNPHSHAGSDMFRFYYIDDMTWNFNPHSHAGSDQAILCPLCNQVKISIHTPTQGVTSIRFVINSLAPISIHTPTQGVTRFLIRRQIYNVNFNPHSHAGSD